MIRHAPRHRKVSDVRSRTQENKIGGGEGPYETFGDGQHTWFDSKVKLRSSAIFSNKVACLHLRVLVRGHI